MWNNDDVKRVILIILDGFGVGHPWGGNAVFSAQMPHWERWMRTYPHTQLEASGKAVGLPGHEIGNSEVGHITLGAGRVIAQDSSRINDTIADGSFFNNKQLMSAFDRAKQLQRPIHCIGLLSDGGVHSAYNHLIALIEMAIQQQVPDVALHLFMDGRDTPSDNGVVLLGDLDQKLTEYKQKYSSVVAVYPHIHIATLCGRYYAMDRDHHPERINKAIVCMTENVGDVSNSPLKVLSNTYALGKSDEFVTPTVIVDRAGVSTKIENGDPVIFFNFRSDRAREVSQALIAHNPDTMLVTFIPYGFSKDSGMGSSTVPAFEFEPVRDGLSEYLSKNGIHQLHIAESEKYAHVTYFFNCGVEVPYIHEERVLIPSSRVSSYDTFPQMSARAIASKAVRALKKKSCECIIMNFANPDMVGHTGNFKATIRALEIIDSLLGEIVSISQKKGWYSIITADHGNVEQMVSPLDGSPDPEHTCNPVPFVIIPPENIQASSLNTSGTLADVAPTVLDILHLQKPSIMTGNTLIMHDGGIHEDSTRYGSISPVS